MANIKDAKDILKAVYQTFHGPKAVGGNDRCSLFYWGRAGVGKSQIVKQAAEELGINFIDRRLAQMEPGDLLGLPVDSVSGEMLTQKWEWFIEQNATGQQMTPAALKGLMAKFEEENPRIMKWTTPDYWPTDDEPCGLLFLDEFNRQTKLTFQASFELVLDGGVSGHRLPPRWMVVAAGNPPEDEEDEYDVFDLDTASLNRFCHIVLEPNSEEWLGWAGEQGLNQDIINFIGSYPEALGLKKCSFELPVINRPRSVAMLGRLLDGGLPDDLEYEVAKGLIGQAFANSFRSSRLQKDKPIPATDILDNYGLVKKKVKEYSGTKSTNRADILKVTCLALLGHLRALEKQRDKKGNIVELSPSQVKNFNSFLKDIPKDLAFGSIKDIVHIVPAHNSIRQDEQLLKMLQEASKGVNKMKTE